MAKTKEQFKAVFKLFKKAVDPKNVKRALEKTFASDETNYNARRVKVEQALVELATAVGKLEQIDHPDAGTHRSALIDLRARASKADKQAKYDAKAAFSALDSIKQDAREQAVEARTCVKKSAMDIPLGDGTTAKVFPNDIPGFDKLDPNAKEKMLQEVAKKISNGKRILQDILEKDLDKLDDPTPKDVTDFIWLLKSKAQETIGEPYERGAMTIPDKGNKIRAYLDRCPEVYGRRSTHFREQQSKKGQQPRGMDFYEGVDRDTNQVADTDLLLPGGMCALLFQQLTMPGGKSEDKERLYIKLETESARLDPLFKATDSTLPPSRELQRDDPIRTVLHLLNAVKSYFGLSQGEDPDLKKFKEEGVKDVKEKMKATLAYLKKANPDAYEILEPAISPSDIGVKSSVRVNEMLAGIERLVAAKDVELDFEGLRLLQAAFDALTDSYEIEGRDATVRAGGEVALFMDDLTGTKKKIDMPESDIIGRIEEELAALEQCEEIDDLTSLKTALVGARQTATDLRGEEELKTSKRAQSGLTTLRTKISDLASRVSMIEYEQASTIENDSKAIGQWMNKNGMAEHAERFLELLQDQVPESQATIRIGVLKAVQREIVMEENRTEKVMDRLSLLIKEVEACQHTDELADLRKVHAQSTQLIKAVRQAKETRDNKLIASTAKYLEAKLGPLGRLIKSLEEALVSA
ncbi:MAG: hypothetical protein KGL52_15555 [Rhodospirillales bacterium]|nr:hypothetical protein [Rhodospirillales bacterium]